MKLEPTLMDSVSLPRRCRRAAAKRRTVSMKLELTPMTSVSLPCCCRRAAANAARQSLPRALPDALNNACWGTEGCDCISFF